jgi:DNA invertase Pin-like site-specific DNA recombinase
MLSLVAEFETNLRRERQMEGIAKAKERGVYQGRYAVKIQGMSRREAARLFGIDRRTVDKMLG